VTNRSGDPPNPPTVRDWEPDVVAPVDEEAGGTWIGYNEHGVFVAITNRWVDGSFGGERSRGLLSSATRSGARPPRTQHGTSNGRSARTRTTDSTSSSPTRARHCTSSGTGNWPSLNLRPGVHVAVNVGADGQYRIPEIRQEAGEDQAANADRLRDHLQPKPGEDGASWLDRAQTAVSDPSTAFAFMGTGSELARPRS